MYGKVKNIWDIKTNGGGSSTPIDTSNFAKKNENNTFTGVNTFENSGSMIKVKTTNDQAFGVEFRNRQDEAVGYVGASPTGSEQKTTIYGALGMNINTLNKDIYFNSGSGDVLSKSTKNWNQQLSDSVLRQRDLAWKRIIDYTSSVRQPETSWNRSSWNWTLSGINNEGIHTIMFVISYQDHVAETFNAQIIWKSGLTESRSQVLSCEKNDRTFLFQFVIKNDGKLYCYIKHDNAGSGATISWVRGWVRRDVSFPDKTNTLW